MREQIFKRFGNIKRNSLNRLFEFIGDDIDKYDFMSADKNSDIFTLCEFLNSEYGLYIPFNIFDKENEIKESLEKEQSDSIKESVNAKSKKKKPIFPMGLRQLKGKIRHIKVFGFDTETHNNNKELSLCSIYGNNYQKTFYSREDFIKELQTNREFRNSYLCATNLGFDFGAIFPNLENALKCFDIIDRNSNIIYARTFCSYDSKDFNFYNFEKIKGKSKEFYPIIFIDSLNHLKNSVEGLGEILKIEKLKKPNFLGEFPKNINEWEELKTYNLRDSEITYRFMEWLQTHYNNLGANLKVTISSTSMDLFRRKYLTMFWKQEEKEKIIEQYNAYYGGRTEAFERGFFDESNYGKIKCYDVKSMYPYCLKNFRYPFPDGRIEKKVKIEDILSFEGICNIEIKANMEMHIPYLPYRSNKLLFPIGTLKGWYDFNSIRNALNYGYEIKEIFNGIVYENKFSPFKDFIKDLWNLREELKKQNDDSNLIPKIIMNSFYGKMGYNFRNKEKIISLEELENRKDYESLNISPLNALFTFFRIKTSDNSYIPSYVFPIIPLYATSYARQEMQKHFKRIGYNRIKYTDTDSIFTNRHIESGSDIGELSLEKVFSELLIVKPKFYMGKTNEKEIIRIKGMYKANDYEKNINMIKKNNFSNNMLLFRKFRTAIKGKGYINETYNILKEMDLNDNKRKWSKRNFSLEPQNSTALCI